MARQRQVVVGPIVGNDYVVQSGLKAGDQLIVGGHPEDWRRLAGAHHAAVREAGRPEGKVNACERAKRVSRANGAGIAEPRE